MGLIGGAEHRPQQRVHACQALLCVTAPWWFHTIAEWDATRIARLVLTAACLGVISTERLRAIRARARA